MQRQHPTPGVPPQSEARPGRIRGFSRAIAGLSWLYTGAIGILWLLLGVREEDCWATALLLYGPRWLSLVPLGVLALAALIVRPRLLWLLLASLVLVVGPVMGLCLPWQTFLGSDPGGPTLRVLSCNVGHDALDARALEQLITETSPDVVALQEWSERHRATVFRQGEWHVHADGGLCLASRHPIVNVERLPLGNTGPGQTGGRWAVIQYDLDTPAGVIHFFNLHLATPRDGLEAVRARGWGGVSALRANASIRRSESETASRWVSKPSRPTGSGRTRCLVVLLRRHRGLNLTNCTDNACGRIVASGPAGCRLGSDLATPWGLLGGIKY